MAKIENMSMPVLARVRGRWGCWTVGPAGGGGAAKWSNGFGKLACSERVRYIYDPIPLLCIYLREMKM